MTTTEVVTQTGNPLPNIKQQKDVPIWLVAVSILLPTAFAMLATSATNVAIPYIAGYFGSTVDEANWVITIYMIANAILIPLTGWLENYMGRVMFLKVFIAIFTIGSVICALAPSLNMLVLGRLIQGIGGGPMMPISQAILIASFPYNKRGQAMALFALAVMVFSIMGPTFGGFIVDNSAWQWIYLANIPVGIFSIVLVHCNIVELKNRVKPDKVDYIGFGALVLWLMSMQIVLDKGQQYNWFDCTWICWLAGISLFSFIFFIVWELEYHSPIVNLRIFPDENNIMNKSILEYGGKILSISQFTLYANCDRGNRPSYMAAMKNDKAIKLYEMFNEELRKYVEVETGIFGADMNVMITNIGPTTIFLDK